MGTYTVDYSMLSIGKTFTEVNGGRHFKVVSNSGKSLSNHHNYEDGQIEVIDDIGDYLRFSNLQFC